MKFQEEEKVTLAGSEGITVATGSSHGANRVDDIQGDTSGTKREYISVPTPPNRNRDDKKGSTFTAGLLSEY